MTPKIQEWIFAMKNILSKGPATIVQKVRRLWKTETFFRTHTDDDGFRKDRGGGGGGNADKPGLPT